MKQIPSILIVTNKGNLIAYRNGENGSPQKIETGFFTEAHEKISDRMSDQAGANAVSGAEGTNSYENLPLLAELDTRCFRKIAQQIKEIMNRENPGSWGLAAPSEINPSIWEHLHDDCKKKLRMNLKVDLTHFSPKDVHSRFVSTANAETWV